MKKVTLILVAILLVAVMALSLVACTDGKVQANLLFGKELSALPTQMDILTSLKNGAADIGVLDATMANYLLATGTYSQDLMAFELGFDEEEYGIAAKKGNEALISKINEALIALATSGDLTTVATTFGLQNELLVQTDTVNPLAASTDGSWNAIVTAKKIVIGYTEFAPIAFKNENDTLTGFDIELAKDVVDYLNTTYSSEIEIEFTKIVWANKEAMLANGSIDLVWNGMTINEERLENMTISVPYLINMQIAVIRKADEAKYNGFASFMTNARNAIIAVEKDSAANELIDLNYGK